MQDLVPLLTAGGAGVLTFISPCVLPLIPGYVAFMTGMTTAELSSKDRNLASILGPALLFVAGFTAVFVAFGASASVIGSFLAKYDSLFRTTSGVVIVLFGVFMLGVVKLPWLYGEARLDLGNARRFGSLTALVMGAAFAFGWSPCVGPVLGSILMMAADSAEVGRGAVLLAVYSLGLGVPFVIVAVMLGRIQPVLGWLVRHAFVINRVAGVILISLGVLILTGWIGSVVGFLSRFVPKIGG